MDKRIIVYRNDSTEIELTSEQLKVLNSPANVVIKGVAGSGKTLLAVLLAEKLVKEGHSVAIIVFTKALKRFIEDKINIFATNLLIDYEYQWNQTIEKYDYIIVDEFQDFSFETLDNIKNRANKGVYFFGDLKQKLYNTELDEKGRETINENGLVKLKLKNLFLTKNFRVPNNVVNLLNDLYEKNYLPQNNKNNNLKAEIHRFESHEEEITFISNLINKLEGNSIGILMDLNGGKIKKIIDAREFFGFGPKDRNTEIVPSIKELAESISKKSNRRIGYKMDFENRLSFENKNSVNILTIHSAKGLEFDVVIIPFVKAYQKFVHSNSIYVAMTRCKEQLYLTYSGYINEDLENIETNLIDGVVKPLPEDEEDIF